MDQKALNTSSDGNLLHGKMLQTMQVLERAVVESNKASESEIENKLSDVIMMVSLSRLSLTYYLNKTIAQEKAQAEVIKNVEYAQEKLKDLKEATATKGVNPACFDELDDVFQKTLIVVRRP